MDTSLLSIVVLVVLTGIYYAIPSIGKPALTLSALESRDAYTQWSQLHVKRMGIFLMVTVVVQLLLSCMYMMTTCGGSIGSNIGSAALYTVVPWVAMFGTVMAVLYAFPGFKTAFSNVVGYFAVSSSANALLSELLVDSSTRATLESITDPAKKSQMATAVEAVMKISDNQSVIINQMNTDNFMQMWNMLAPLMKEGVADNTVKKQALLDLVVLKDNIGESMWYVYVGVLLSSLVMMGLGGVCKVGVSEQRRGVESYKEAKEGTGEGKEGGVEYVSGVA